MITTAEILKNAREVKPYIATLTTEKKNSAIMTMADCLVEATDEILAANRLDIEAARGTVSDVMIDRLALSEDRIKGMADGMKQVASLPDPVGRVLASHTRFDGLLIEKTAVPMGVVAIIYESRPNVTSDAAVLAFKSGNVCVLRGGKEAFRTSFAVVSALRKGLEKEGLPKELISIVEDTTRASANELMTAVGFVDLLIPRGGKGLITACTENAKVSCIETGTGICTIYVDKDADLEKAVNIIENAKTSRPSVCNACETCLVDRNVAAEFLPKLYDRLCVTRSEKGLSPVELRLCAESGKIIDGVAATDADFDTEFLDYILAVKVVDGVKEATSHIATHSTGHSESIITENRDAANYFTAAVDSAAVYVNASTRFTDGGEFGLGCEMGISTQKLHARGPMGLDELTTYKYIVRGNGQIR